MIGNRTVMQEALFYSFSLEDHVPQSHLLRAVDRFVDLNGIREEATTILQRDGPPTCGRLPLARAERKNLIGSLASICPAFGCNRTWSLAKMVSAA